MNQREHWEHVYSTRTPDKVGWYKPHLETSLNWIKKFIPDRKAHIVDVGGGASTLIDDLLADGYRSITVVDLSRTALATARKRLGKNAEAINWLEGDITTVSLPADYYELWHDRAVFHFLTAPEQRQQYVYQLLKAIKTDGHLIIATFAPEAPPKCSGLPVERYNADQLEKTLGPEFVLKQHLKEMHVTPGGIEQMYLYCHFQKTV